MNQMRVSAQVAARQSRIVGNDQQVPVLDGGRLPYVNPDNAASTPVLREVLDTVVRFMDWYCSVHRGAGCKSQVSTDADEQARGIVADFVGASLDTTTAKVHDSEVWADKGHVSAARVARVQGAGQGLGVMRKAPMGGKLHPLDDRINRVIAMVRAKVEQGPEPVSFRSLESNTRHQADRKWQRNTATSSSAGLVGVA